jgi:hypothetical protein
MKLKINIKPQTTEKRHKPRPNDLIYGFSWGQHGSEFAYGFVYHKVRRKVKTSKKVKKMFNGVEVKTTKRTYEPAKWVVSYYKIPLAVLKFMNVKLEQGTRSFKLVPKK